MAKHKKKGNAPMVQPQMQPGVKGQSPTTGATPAQSPFQGADRPDVVPLIQELEKQRGARVITYFLDDTGGIAFDAMPAFYDQLTNAVGMDAIDLWIHSHGGRRRSLGDWYK